MATERTQAQTKAHLAHIVDLIHRLRAAQDAGDEAAEDAARAEIEDLPLEVLVRFGWRRPDEDVGPPEEYQITLATDGPEVRITGALDRWGCPISAVLQHTNWDKPWMTYPADAEEEQALLEFARQFYYWG